MDKTIDISSEAVSPFIATDTAGDAVTEEQVKLLGDFEKTKGAENCKSVPKMSEIYSGTTGVVVKKDNVPVMSSRTIFKGYQTSKCAFPLHPTATGTLAKGRKIFRSIGIRHPFFGTVVPGVF